MSREGALWIGGLEPYMDEEFIRNSLSLMGEDKILSIKVIKNKFTGVPASYGFINFEDDSCALLAMHKLNGKIIPNSTPPVRFQLCPANTKMMEPYDKEQSKDLCIWISELTPDVSEDDLKKTFSTRFESFELCKLLQDKPSDALVGYVRFNEPNDQRNALIHMNGFLGLGSKALRITLLAPKHYFATLVREEAYVVPTSKSNKKESAISSGWSSRPRIVAGTQGSADGLSFLDNLPDSENEDEEDGNRIIEYNIPVNVDGLNTAYISRSQEVWDGVERDRWLYCFDDEDGFVPHFEPQSS